MKTNKTFIIGSKYFFDKYEDYVSKDEDVLCLMTEWRIPTTNCLRLCRDGKDIMYYKKLSKEEFIQETLETKNKLKVGKFLIPEFVEHINFNIEDLIKMHDLFLELDEKHHYELIICDAYIKNNDFTLTDEQRDAAYMDYKRARNL